MEKAKPKVGRPHSKNPRSYVVPETRMTREEYRMVTLKAAMYTGGNTAEFIRLASKKFEGEMKTLPCMEQGCAGTLHSVKADDFHTFKIGDKEHEIVLRGMPIFECDICQIREIDVNLAAEVERAVDDEIGWRIQHRRSVPDELDFIELITN